MHIYEIDAVVRSKHKRLTVIAPHSCKAVLRALDLLFPDLSDDAPIPSAFSLTVKCRSPKS